MLSSIFRGEASLPKTFWLYFVVVYLVNDLLQDALLESRAPPVLLVLLVLVAAVYLPLILIGVWRSAGRYHGNRIWTILARLVAGFGLIIFILRLIGMMILLIG